MSEGESKTAYEQFLEQAQEEVVHQERATQDDFLNYRDIANRLYAIAKKESLPYLTNRFQLLAGIVVILLLFGHGAIFLFTGFAKSELDSRQKAEVSDISKLQGLSAAQRGSFTEKSQEKLKASIQDLDNKTLYLQLILAIGTGWIVLSVVVSCRNVSDKNSERNLFQTATTATHNFLLWKLRSPSNASTYSIFVDFDQIDADDIDYEQLQELFANAHHSWNRRGIFDYVLMAIVALPALLVPVYGLGMYFWLVSFGISIAIARHSNIVGPYECLDCLPEPLAAPYPQHEMAKSDGEDGYPG